MRAVQRSRADVADGGSYRVLLSHVPTTPTVHHSHDEEGEGGGQSGGGRGVRQSLCGRGTRDPHAAEDDGGNAREEAPEHGHADH
eukprot:31935-Eustigmatos_ZCMA.PRE.1